MSGDFFFFILDFQYCFESVVLESVPKCSDIHLILSFYCTNSLEKRIFNGLLYILCNVLYYKCLSLRIANIRYDCCLK